MSEIPKQYEPASVEDSVSSRWLEAKAFSATPDERENRYVIMMPLPNVTGALHMGHAMDNVMQDMLIRWHRMRGDNTLWMAGTDHAGIGTQAVVEKRLFELEGKTRHDLGREALVERIWAWKDQYQARIVEQLQSMGCSCDWDRQRFTMDRICARAVRHTFFKMFKAGLIYQGNRLVNWDCHLETAVADDELYRENVDGHFWHLRYPVIHPKPGEPEHVVVATTRPETMLGDTAVACHPEPAKALASLIEKTEERLAAASAKDREGIASELERLREREKTQVAALEQIVEMARDGRHIMLPLQERPIPIICDEWAKPELGSGCVKITPAHDPNDYEVWLRHREEIDIINILETNGSLGAEAGKYEGLDRFEARKRVVADLEAQHLLEGIEERSIEIDHSDRSKTIVEPYLSKQWFVRMGDVEGGVTMGKGTDKEFKIAGLAQAAISAADGEWTSSSGRKLSFHPDQDRYHKIYHSWLKEKRDWCISRQLWWGHRIPVWQGRLDREALLTIENSLRQFEGREDVASWLTFDDGERLNGFDGLDRVKADESITAVEAQVCFRDEARDEAMGTVLRMGGLEMDPDVLDTWFSSSLWPHSTLGWPDPRTAQVEPGQSSLAAREDGPDCLEYYYPGSCLVTGRDIITLWVARMVVMGLYNMGDMPFTDVFLHATILDGRGERMSKSKGNGIDPIDMVDRYGADALRFVLSEMQTGTQDIRLPVQAISPFDGEPVDLAKAKRGSTLGTYVDPRAGKEFDVVGLMADHGVPQAKTVSERFEDGRKFANKLWNGMRFALLNLDETRFEATELSALNLEDRWICSRLSATIDAVHEQLEAYNPSAAVLAVRDFFWYELCDWYLELIKPRMQGAEGATMSRQILAATLDQVLRLLHPFMPFISEELWARLGEAVVERGVDRRFASSDLLALASWPEQRRDWRDSDLEQSIELMQEVVRQVREVRARYQVPPSQKVEIVIKASKEALGPLQSSEGLLGHMAGAASLNIDSAAAKPKGAATAVIQSCEVYVLGVIDPEKERVKLEARLSKLQAQIGGIKKKLGNESFVAKAPAEVVAKQRTQLTELESQAESLQASLQDL